MKRRSFIKKIAQMSAGIAIAAHLKFGSLVPIPEIKQENQPLVPQENFSLLVDPTLTSHVYLDGVMMRAVL